MFFFLVFLSELKNTELGFALTRNYHKIVYLWGSQGKRGPNPPEFELKHPLLPYYDEMSSIDTTGMSMQSLIDWLTHSNGPLNVELTSPLLEEQYQKSLPSTEEQQQLREMVPADCSYPQCGTNSKLSELKVCSGCKQVSSLYVSRKPQLLTSKHTRRVIAGKSARCYTGQLNL